VKSGAKDEASGVKSGAVPAQAPHSKLPLLFYAEGPVARIFQFASALGAVTICSRWQLQQFASIVVELPAFTARNQSLIQVRLGLVNTNPHNE
jgi:hypothetical protein